MEPKITINGADLTTAQATAVRVAIFDFCVLLADPDMLGDDDMARALTVAYRARIAEVLRLMQVAA